MHNMDIPMVRTNERLRAIEHTLETLGQPELLINRIVRLEQKIYQIKDVLTFDEACEYIGISESLLYKLTAAKEIPHFKPRGKMLYFKRVKIDEWLLQNRISPIGAITQTDLGRISQTNIMNNQDKESK